VEGIFHPRADKQPTDDEYLTSDGCDFEERVSFLLFNVAKAVWKISLSSLAKAKTSGRARKHVPASFTAHKIFMSNLAV
jgi:hypothetical protein